MEYPTNIRLLIVEDDPLIAEDIRTLLLSENFKIAGVAHDGTTALDYLSNRQPNFAVLDIHLGSGLSGLDVAEVIHRDYDLPYIFLTSFDDAETLQEAQQHSPYGFLVKPFQDRTLLTTIRIAHHNFEQVKTAGPLSKTQIETKFNTKITEQEYTITTALLDGKSYKEIAALHHVSINTVKFHAKNIYTKLDISGRSAIASKLLGI